MKPKQNSKTSDIEIKSLNGYDATRERLDENNTLTVKQPVVVNEKPKAKASIGFNKDGHILFLQLYTLKNYGALSSK